MAAARDAPVYWLLLDAGNSALKWVLLAPDGHVGPGHGAVRNAAPAELAPRLRGEWQLLAGVRLGGAWGCGVSAPMQMRCIEQEVERHFGVAVQWFKTQRHFEVEGMRLDNGYLDPGQLGVDRWHALIGARASYPDQPIVVVTAGTATTVDGVSRDGRFVGGAIAPGVRMMFESLARGTARLPYAQGTLTPYPLDTDNAISSGVLGAQLGLIERFVRGFRADHGEPRVLLSGGYADRLLPYLGQGTALPDVVREDNLVLRGVFLRVRAAAEDASARAALQERV